MKKTYLVGALMIGASVIFARPIKAQANPTAGVTVYIQGVMSEPPITEWQKDIYYIIADSNPAVKERKQSKKKESYKKKVNPIPSNPKLTRRSGIFMGPSGKESYYNLDMSGVISIMEGLGYHYRYWIREDGVKMYGDYVMVAADLRIRPKGTILDCSLGKAIVCDTGTFVRTNSCQLDIATTW